MRVVERERFKAGAGKGFEIDPAEGEDRQEMEKRYYFDGTNLTI